MTDSEVIELDGQYDLALAGNPAAPGDDPAATQQLCLVGLMGAVDRATLSNPGTDAAPLRRSPDFRRLKEALRSQPPELTAQLREPADQPADNLRTRLWQRLRSQTAMLRWQVVAWVCGLSLVLSLIALFADLDAALALRTEKAQNTSVRPASEPGSAAHSAATPRAMLPRLPREAAVPVATMGGSHPSMLVDASGENPLTLSLSAGSRSGQGAALPIAPERRKIRAARDLDEGTPAAPSETGEGAYELAHRLVQAGDRAGAERAFRQALEQASAPAAAYDLGYLLQQQGRYAEAAMNYQLAVRLAPGRAYVLYDLGSVLAKLGRLNEAAASFERAAALDAANPFILYDWGWALERAGALALAEDKYRHALAAGANTVAGTNARARLHALGWHLTSKQ
jgi:tetratricopeptide (TPR) repeat protein